MFMNIIIKMKPIKLIIAIAFLSALTVNAQEKKIKFNKGTLKICSSKNFVIEGYDGNEVICNSRWDTGANDYDTTIIKQP